MSQRDVFWNVYDYSKTAQRQAQIRSHNTDPSVSQHDFVFGDDDGSESAYTADTQGANRTLTQDGGGNYQFFIDILLSQSESGADQNLTRTYELRYQKNGTGGYATVPTTGGYTSEGVRLYNSSNITDGGATSERFTGPTSAAWLAGEIIDGAGDATFDSIAWSNKPTNGEWTRLLACLEIVDADTAASDYYEFRIYESGGTALAGGYTATPRITWNAGAITVNPTPVTFAGSVVGPTVSLGGITANPTPVTAAWGVVNPTVSLGALSVVPSPVAAAFGIVGPSVDFTTFVAPTPIASAFNIPNPSVSLGEITVSPLPVTGSFLITDPSVSLGELQLTPIPVTSAFSINGPSVDTSLIISPVPISLAFTIVAPSVQQQLTVNPSPVTAVWGVFGPSVSNVGGDPAASYYPLITLIDLTTIT